MKKTEVDTLSKYFSSLSTVENTTECYADNTQAVSTQEKQTETAPEVSVNRLSTLSSEYDEYFSGKFGPVKLEHVLLSMFPDKAEIRAGLAHASCMNRLKIYLLRQYTCNTVSFGLVEWLEKICPVLDVDWDEDDILTEFPFPQHMDEEFDTRLAVISKAFAEDTAHRHFPEPTMAEMATDKDTGYLCSEEAVRGPMITAVSELHPYSDVSGADLSSPDKSYSPLEEGDMLPAREREPSFDTPPSQADLMQEDIAGSEKLSDQLPALISLTLLTRRGIDHIEAELHEFLADPDGSKNTELQRCGQALRDRNVTKYKKWQLAELERFKRFSDEPHIVQPRLKSDEEKILLDQTSNNAAKWKQLFKLFMSQGMRRFPVELADLMPTDHVYRALIETVMVEDVRILGSTIDDRVRPLNFSQTCVPEKHAE